jgi:hypothetical protein
LKTPLLVDARAFVEDLHGGGILGQLPGSRQPRFLLELDDELHRVNDGFADTLLSIHEVQGHRGDDRVTTPELKAILNANSAQEQGLVAAFSPVPLDVVLSPLDAPGLPGQISTSKSAPIKR